MFKIRDILKYILETLWNIYIVSGSWSGVWSEVWSKSIILITKCVRSAESAAEVACSAVESAYLAVETAVTCQTPWLCGNARVLREVRASQCEYLFVLAEEKKSWNQLWEASSSNCAVSRWIDRQSSLH